MFVPCIPILFLTLAAQAPAQAAPPPSVAVFNLEPRVDASKDLAVVLTERVVMGLREASVFNPVVGPRELAVRLSPAEATQIARCAKDSCGLLDVELAGALGVSHLMVGSVAKVGKTYVLNLSLMELRTGLAVGAVSRDVPSDDESKLFAQTNSAVLDLVTRSGLLRPVAGAPAGGSRGSVLMRVAGLGVGGLAVALGLAGALAGITATVALAVISPNLAIAAGAQVDPVIKSASVPYYGALFTVPTLGVLGSLALVSALAAAALAVGLVVGERVLAEPETSR